MLDDVLVYPMAPAWVTSLINPQRQIVLTLPLLQIAGSPYHVLEPVSVIESETELLVPYSLRFPTQQSLCSGERKFLWQKTCPFLQPPGGNHTTMFWKPIIQWYEMLVTCLTVAHLPGKVQNAKTTGYLQWIITIKLNTTES